MTKQTAKQFIVAYREKKGRKKEDWNHEYFFTSLMVTHIDGKELSCENQFDLGWVRANQYIRHQEKYFGKDLEFTILVKPCSMAEVGEVKQYTAVVQPYKEKETA
jgi:hypothetical protein